MAEENIRHEFRSKKINETRNYLIEEINRNELKSQKHKKFCITLNYIDHFLHLGTATTGCISISAFASLVAIPIGVSISATGLKMCAITAAIKNYKSIIKKKKKYDKIVFLAESKLNSIEGLISKALNDSVISHDEFVLINNVLKEYNEMKESIKSLNT